MSLGLTRCTRIPHGMTDLCEPADLSPASVKPRLEMRRWSGWAMLLDSIYRGTVNRGVLFRANDRSSEVERDAGGDAILKLLEERRQSFEVSSFATPGLVKIAPLDRDSRKLRRQRLNLEGIRPGMAGVVQCRSELDHAFEKQRGAAGDGDAVAEQLAEQLSAAARELAREQPVLVETAGPVRDQGAVGGAGDGILGHALGGREEAADKVAGMVAGLAGSGDDDGEAVDLRQEIHIRREGANLLLRVIDDHVIARGPDFTRVAAERGQQRRRGLDRLRRAGREVERQQIE